MDIVDIKNLVKKGKIYFYVFDKKIYCANEEEEAVLVGEMK